MIGWGLALGAALALAMVAVSWPWCAVAAWLVLGLGSRGVVWASWRRGWGWTPVAGLVPLLLVVLALAVGVGSGDAVVSWAGAGMVRELASDAAGRAQLRAAGPEMVARVQVLLALTSPLYGMLPGLTAAAWARSAPPIVGGIGLVGIQIALFGPERGALASACWGLLAVGWGRFGLLPAAASLGALHGLWGLAPAVVEPATTWGAGGPLALVLAATCGAGMALAGRRRRDVPPERGHPRMVG